MPTDAPPSVSQRLAGLLVLALLVGTTNGLSRIAMPFFAAHVGAQAWQVGLVGGLGYAGMLLLSLPMGALMERHGGRRLFVRGTAAAAALYLLVLPQVHAAWPAIAGAGLLGLLLPFRVLPVQTEFLHLLPQLDPSRAGWNRAANMLGMFLIGPTLAAALVAALGFALTFVIVALMLLGAVLVGRRALDGDGETLPQDAALSLWARMRAQLSLLAERRDLRRAMGYDLLVQMAVAYFVVFVIVLGVRRFGLSVPAAAGLVTLQGVVYVLTLFLGGRLLDGHGEDRRYAIAFACLLGCTLAIGFAGVPALLWLGAALLGLGLGVQSLTSVTRFAALMQHHGRGRVSGLISLAPPAGGVIGAVLGGVLSQHFGPQAGFRVLALAFALALGWVGWRARAGASRLRG